MALTHFDAAGHAHMVDVSEKPVTARIAIARGKRIAKLVGQIKIVGVELAHHYACGIFEERRVRNMYVERRIVQLVHDQGKFLFHRATQIVGSAQSDVKGVDQRRVQVAFHL